jgi:hypothetical protein
VWTVNSGTAASAEAAIASADGSGHDGFLMPTTPSDDQAAFIEAWNGTPAGERRQIRRLVRIGRPVETAEQASLAVGFADYQSTRTWWRFFWFWFVPAVVIALIAAVNIHPIVIGIVLGGAASAFMIRRNFKRVQIINKDYLEP